MAEYWTRQFIDAEGRLETDIVDRFKKAAQGVVTRRFPAAKAGWTVWVTYVHTDTCPMDLYTRYREVRRQSRRTKEPSQA